MKDTVYIQGEEEDISTFQVIAYLKHFGQSYFKSNRKEEITIESLRFEDSNPVIEFKIGSTSITTERIKSYWYRRGELLSQSPSEVRAYRGIPSSTLKKHGTLENRSLVRLLNNILESCPKSIGSIYAGDCDKLEQLRIANECKFQIPKTYVVTSRVELSKLIQKHGKLITKGINNTFSEHLDGVSYYMYTSVIDKDTFNNVPSNFAPTLFQNYIEKFLELRIFYLHGKFYSMGIFSQSNKQTKTDFRNYDLEQPNRTVPVILPHRIEQQLTLLMSKLNLDTGSIDLILTPQSEYVFLEVNPDGQFGMVSYPCNYFIERSIAKYLSQ